MTNVTQKMAFQKHKYKEQNQTFYLQVVPQMTSTLLSDLIFGNYSNEEDREITPKVGSANNRIPTNNEKRENLSRLTLPSIVNKYFNSRNNRLALIC